MAATQPVIPPHLFQTRVLKLALDVHLLHHVVAMQYDGQCPKPPQRFTPKDFMTWTQKQIAQGWRVVSCYEAGPFGYTLHRQLVTLGATNYVIRGAVFPWSRRSCVYAGSDSSTPSPGSVKPATSPASNIPASG